MLAVPAPLTSIHFPLANSYTPPALGPAAAAEGHADTAMTATGTASTAANPAASWIAGAAPRPVPLDASPQDASHLDASQPLSASMAVPSVDMLMRTTRPDNRNLTAG